MNEIKIVKKIATILRVQPEDVPKVLKRFKKEITELRSEQGK